MLTTTLSADALQKAYPPRPPLFARLDFSVERGLTAVTGRNGSGKTTLLKILAGLARPSSGRVRVERGGRALPPAERRLAIGWAGPDLSLYAELSGQENLEFFCRAAGRDLAPAEIRRRLEATGLGHEALDRRVGEYSTGMKQRLRLAFALLFDPPILVLDEPMTGLDPEGREHAFRAIAAARERGAVLLASNDARDFDSPDQRIELGGAT